MPQVLSVRVSLVPFLPSSSSERDTYGSWELQVDDSLAWLEDTPPAHTSMSGIHFGEPVCPPPTRYSESGTQWGQAAAERE